MNLIQRYRNAIKNSIVGWYYIDQEFFIPFTKEDPRVMYLQAVTSRFPSEDIYFCRKKKFNPDKVKEGKLSNIPSSFSFLGLKRLDNLEFCFNEVIKQGIEGDLIETGVWRGGATIFMKALLESIGDTTRKVWVADSFQGCPPADPAYPADEDNYFQSLTALQVNREDVEKNFRRFDLLDDRVVFLEGWFKDTLPVAPIEKLSILRLDGDMYQSTIEALNHLYPKLSKGGYVIIDDYHYVECCKQAVDDYRAQHGITDEIIGIDWTGVYWKKTQD